VGVQAAALSPGVVRLGAQAVFDRVVTFEGVGFMEWILRAAEGEILRRERQTLPRARNKV